MIVWGITDGSAGMVAQTRALAVALGYSIEQKTIALKSPWKFLPNIFYALVPKGVIFCALKDKKNLQGTPDIIISCGRKGALAALALKSKFPSAKIIHIQDPQMPARFFDLVVAMAHDKITGDNVIKTTFALHTITPETLAAARSTFAARFAQFPSPRVAVLLGGSTNKYRLTAAHMELVIQSLEKLLAEGNSLFITPSRRTGAENIALLKARLGNNPRVYIYDFVEENPYMGLLALADTIAVTNDSVNMMSEAYATGKKLHILHFEGHKNTKPSRFADMLMAKTHAPENEMTALASDVKKRLTL